MGISSKDFYRQKKWYAVAPFVLIILIAISAYFIVDIYSTNNKQPLLTDVNETIHSVNIYTKSEGLYQISGNELKELGFSVKSGEENRLRLTLRGEGIPLWVEERDDLQLLFYGHKNESIYQKENVYQLSLDESPSEFTVILDDKCDNLPSKIVPEDTAYKAILILEENNDYLPQVEGGDHWLWNAIPASHEQPYNFEIDDLQDGPGAIAVNVWGNTQSPGSPDHHLKIMLNDVLIADQSWDGIGWYELISEIPDGVLYVGKNTLIIQSPGDTGAVAENNYLDNIKIEFLRRPIAQDSVLIFNGSGESLQLSNLSGLVSILDITDPTKPYLIGRYNVLADTLPFATEAGKRYIAAAQEGWLRPSRITATNTEFLFDTANPGANYIAIGDPALLAGLEPLLQSRREQGLEVVSLPLQAIYDQFNYGYEEPLAIKNFLQYLASTRQIAPKYVLLVGDSTFDFLGYTSDPPEYLLPSYFVQTEYGGQTVSDVMYAFVNPDRLPDVAIGRLPARTLQEVEDWVQKTLEFEQALVSITGEEAVLAVADGQDPSFKYEAERFLANFPPLFITRLIAPVPGDNRVNADITSALNTGILFSAYFGHGSLTMWGKDRLYTVEDVEDMNNTDTPILLQFTCLTGLFTHPKITSLTEAFLFHETGGAVASLAPTSLTLPIDQSNLSRPLAQALADPDVNRLGDALLFAQRQAVTAINGSDDVLLTFLLFGDPALLIRR
jgi:hypothetical protein